MRREASVSAKNAAEIDQAFDTWCDSAANCAATVDLPYLRINSTSFARCKLEKNCMKKLILGWTNDQWTKHDYLAKCPKFECEVSDDESRIEDADAVVFHIRNHAYSQGGPPLPTKRHARQRYVFYSMESPAYIFLTFERKHENFFNWTMTYRLDSDVPDPYGVIARLRRPRDDFDLSAIIDKKSLFAAQFVSNCDTHSKRELLTAELHRYVHIDVIGKCGPRKCGKAGNFGSDNECLSRLKKYRFYLAFENSVCDGYVTEKFFRYVQYNVVPVVLNGANYKRIAPRGSYIAADDFENAKELAKYLLYLAENRTAYGEYLSWHREYVSLTLNSLSFIDFRDFWGFCALCAKLWNEDAEISTSFYSSIHDWWIEQSHCKPSFTLSLL